MSCPFSKAFFEGVGGSYGENRPRIIKPPISVEDAPAFNAIPRTIR